MGLSHQKFLTLKPETAIEYLEIRTESCKSLKDGIVGTTEQACVMFTDFSENFTILFCANCCYQISSVLKAATMLWL